MSGVIQALFGGQPLLIVGVAEPIVLIYKYMYDFAKDREGMHIASLLSSRATFDWTLLDCCYYKAVDIF